MSWSGARVEFLEAVPGLIMSETNLLKLYLSLNAIISWFIPAKNRESNKKEKLTENLKTLDLGHSFCNSF